MLALNYSGSWPFMVDMRRLAMRSSDWLPSPKQVAAIGRCVARDSHHRSPEPDLPKPLNRRDQAAAERERRYLSGRL